MPGSSQAAPRHLAPATVNRILAAVSAFYEHLVVAGKRAHAATPIQRTEDHAAARVPDRHRSFLEFATSRRSVRRAVRAKTAQRLPRPLGDAEVAQLLGSLRRRRDRAMVLLMLQGGPRPGEVPGRGRTVHAPRHRGARRPARSGDAGSTADLG